MSARRELTIHTGNSSYQNLMKDFSVLKKIWHKNSPFISEVYFCQWAICSWNFTWRSTGTIASSSLRKTRHLQQHYSTLPLLQVVSGPHNSILKVIPWLCSLHLSLRIVRRQLRKQPSLQKDFWNKVMHLKLNFAVDLHVAAGCITGCP